MLVFEKIEKIDESIFDEENELTEEEKYLDKKLADYYQKMSNKTDDSYENDYSNVVRLFKYYTKGLNIVYYLHFLTLLIFPVNK